MFFYVSFLRPPPVQSTLSGTIAVTPQIANDLRTEQFDGSEDIYYSWAQEAIASTTTSGQTSTILTRPAKLTTWRQSNAYKEIPVPLPSNVKEGQTWRLVLTAHRPLSSPRLPVIQLHDERIGEVAFPVLSAPIRFGSRNTGKAKKQEQIERVYEIRPPSQDVEAVSLRLVEQTSFDLDKKIWDSGIGLSSWLVGLQNTPQNVETVPAVTCLRDGLFGSGSRKILELGTGIGIVSLTLATLREIGGCLSGNSQDRIIATDLDTAMPILGRNITTNKNNFSTNSVTGTVLDWDQSLPSFATEFPEGFDVVVMADVTYNTASFPHLVRTLSDLVGLGTKPPLVLLGYKERDPAERTLWHLMEGIGLRFEKVAERRGAGEVPVEIWMAAPGTQLLEPVHERNQE